MRDIPQDCDPAPIIRIYVDLNLQTLHKAGVISGPVPALPVEPQEAALPPATCSAQAADRGDSSALGHMQSSLGSGSGQMPQTEGRNARTASGAVENSPLSPAGSLASPGSQARPKALLQRCLHVYCMLCISPLHGYMQLHCLLLHVVGDLRH